MAGSTLDAPEQSEFSMPLNSDIEVLDSCFMPVGTPSLPPANSPRSPQRPPDAERTVEPRVEEPSQASKADQATQTVSLSSQESDRKSLHDEPDGTPHGDASHDTASLALGAATGPPTSFPPILQPANLWTQEVLCNGTPVEALVDSGGATTLIWESYLPAGVELRPTDTKLVGISGELFPRGEAILSVEIPGFCMAETYTLVVPDDSVALPLVLGTNYFQQNGLILDLRFNTFRFSPEKMNMSTPVSFNATSTRVSLPVYAAQDTSLVPGIPAEVTITLEAPMATLYYFESTVSQTGLESPCGLLHFKEEGSVPTSKILMNLSRSLDQEGHLIKKGQCVGLVTEILEPEDYSESIKEDDWTLERMLQEIDLTTLSEDQASRVYDMLARVPDVLGKGDKDVGCALVPEHRIELTNLTPIRHKVRRFSEPLEKDIDDQCQELLTLDIIEPSYSAWSAPIVPIRKKDGSLRLCVDYRKLNAVTKQDSHPIGNMQDILFSLHGQKFFTSLDLVRGYYQVPLEEGSREFTAFSTSTGHFHFKRLPFGLKNAPSAFQRAMQSVLRLFSSADVSVYLDDVLIRSRTFEEHLCLVHSVLETFARYGIKIKPSKCHWFKQSVPFLGHIISEQGLAKTPQYVEQIQNFPKPTTRKELRSFLGLVNFQRKFIPNCSSVAQPLSEKTAEPKKGTSSYKKEKLVWTPAMEEAFHKLKQLMKEDLLLSYPDYSDGAEKLELYVDASGTGAGACLKQLQDGDRRVIGYSSRCFSKAQRQYSVIERELAAIRWAVKTFRPFIYGVPVILYTDHRPLTYLKTMASENARVNRTMLELEEYDIEFRYCRGTDNTAADIMSRLGTPVETTNQPPDPSYLPPGISAAELVKAAGGGDSLVESLLRVLRYSRPTNGKLPESTLELRHKLVKQLLDAPSKYGMDKSKRVKRGIKMMIDPGVLLCPEILLVASDLFNVKILVHYGTDRPLIYYHPNPEQHGEPTRVHLQLLAGVHYNPLVETSRYQPEAKTDCILQVDQENTDLTPSESQEDSAERDCISREEEPSEEEADLNIAAIWPEDVRTGYTCSCSSSSVVVTDVEIGSVTACALLDTGASVSVIKNSLWQALPSEIQEEARLPQRVIKSLKGVGDGSTDVLEVVFLPVSVLGIKGTTSFPFVVIESLNTCVLLGLNFLKRYSFLLDFERDLYWCSYEGHSLTYNLNPVTVMPGNVHYFAWINPHADVFPTLSQVIPLEEIRQLQRGNRHLSRLRTNLARNLLPKDWQWQSLQKFKRYATNLRLFDGVLCYQQEGQLVPVVTAHFLVGLALNSHRQLAHAGRMKLHEAIRDVAWHPSLDSIVRDVCFSCHQCQVTKLTPVGKAPPVLKICLDRPMELVAADLIEFPRTSRGHTAALVVVDHYSKWLAVAPLKDKRGPTVAEAFEHRILPSLVRCPERLLSDNGPEFCSTPFSRVLDRYGIEHTFATPYRPSANGAVERVNRTLAGLLRSLSQDGEEWDRVLAKATLTYNHTIHREIKVSPSECLFAKPHQYPSTPPIPNSTKDTWKEGHPAFTPYRKGQLVLYKLPKSGAIKPAKLAVKFEGPFFIHKVHGNGVTYVIAREMEGEIHFKHAHHSQLKRYVRVPSYIANHPSFFQDPTKEQRKEESDSPSTDPCFLFVASGTTSETETTSSSPDTSPSDRPPRHRRHHKRSYRSTPETIPSRALADLPCSEEIPQQDFQGQGLTFSLDQPPPDHQSPRSCLASDCGLEEVAQEYNSLCQDLCDILEQVLLSGIEQQTPFGGLTSTPCPALSSTLNPEHVVMTPPALSRSHLLQLLDQIRQSREDLMCSYSENFGGNSLGTRPLISPLSPDEPQAPVADFVPREETIYRGPLTRSRTRLQEGTQATPEDLASSVTHTEPPVPPSQDAPREEDTYRGPTTRSRARLLQKQSTRSSTSLSH